MSLYYSYFKLIISETKMPPKDILWGHQTVEKPHFSEGRGV